jgi:hypothetical protein
MPDQQSEQRIRALWRGSPYPNSEEATADTVQAALDAVVALARTANRQRAREICAAIVFDAQPIIAARTDLLRATVHALLIAQAFRLLSRVVLAISGRTVKVVLLLQCPGPIAPPRSIQEPERTIYAVDPRWVDRLSPNDMFLRHWCDALSARQHSHAGLAGTAPVSRQLEPA